MVFETEAAVRSPEIPEIRKILLEFEIKKRFSKNDRRVELEEEENKFKVDYKRPFNNTHRQYVFENGQFTQVVLFEDPIPGTPFLHKLKIVQTPAEAGVTPAMVLHLVRSVKQDERTFGKTHQ